jgi:hypothetical protein
MWHMLRKPETHTEVHDVYGPPHFEPVVRGTHVSARARTLIWNLTMIHTVYTGQDESTFGQMPLAVGEN